jgi:hypothetical protein
MTRKRTPAQIGESRFAECCQTGENARDEGLHEPSIGHRSRNRFKSGKDRRLSRARRGDVVFFITNQKMYKFT